jgi:DNA-directed RNA polymerase specialized sigma24 family protein
VRAAVHDIADRTDAQLVQLARDGDTAAWGVLVDRYSAYVHAIAVRAFGLRDREADDVFQEVFRRLYADLGALRGELRAPVGRATRNLCLDRCSYAALEPATAVTLLRIEAAMDVHVVLGSLDELDSNLLYRFFVLNETYRAIAEDLGVAVTAVPGRIASALIDLCELLAAERDVT